MGEISKKVQESRLKWYGHVLRRKDECMRRPDSDEDGGAERKTKVGVVDSFRNDLWERELSREDAQDRPRCKRFTRRIDPT